MSEDKGFDGIAGPGIFSWPEHYAILNLDNMNQVRSIFDNGENISFEMNWLFLSTSGVHGTYTTLEEIEEKWGIEQDDYGEKYYLDSVTVLIVQPRLCTLWNGHVKIEKEDIPYLRNLVSKTINGITRTQKGNIQSLRQKASKGGDT